MFLIIFYFEKLTYYYKMYKYNVIYYINLLKKALIVMKNTYYQICMFLKNNWKIDDKKWKYVEPFLYYSFS